jgi:hypothetical protein
LKSIFLSNRIDPELHNRRSYVSSYRFSRDHKELFRVHLNKMAGFYLMSEFVGSKDDDNFVIEQTNRAGTPKISIYQKNSGILLGAVNGNLLLDGDENPIGELKSAESLVQATNVRLAARDNDLALVNLADNKVTAVFSQLPRKETHPSWLTHLTKLTRLTSGPKTGVMEIALLQDKSVDLRVILAAAVVVHSRGGLQAQ